MVTIFYQMCLILILLLPLADSIADTAALCHEGNVTGNHVILNMTTSLIAESNGSCCCRISVDVPLLPGLQLSLKALTSPKCTTNIELLIDFLQPTCNNGEYEENTKAFTRPVHHDEEICIIVKSRSNNREEMSGTVEIKTHYKNQTFNLECFNASSNASSLTTVTTVKRSASTPSDQGFTTQTPPKTTGESINGLPANEPLKGGGNNNLPVPLIAGCASGGCILLIVLVMLAVACHRHQKKKPHQGKNDNRTKDSDDEYLSMENDLYVTSADLNSYPHQSTLRDSSNVGIYGNLKDCITPKRYSSQGHLTADGMKTGYLQAPNGDLYTLVHKP